MDSGGIWCSRTNDQSIATNYEAVQAYPTYDVTGTSPEVQTAYSNYRQAIDVVLASNRDLYTMCIDWLAKGKPEELISRITWSIARTGINDALALIIPAIELLQ